MSHPAQRPTIPEVIDDFAAYHQLHPSWGALHVVLSDGNVRDIFVDGCIEYAQQIGDAEGERLARILRTLILTQRGKLDRMIWKRGRMADIKVTANLIPAGHFLQKTGALVAIDVEKLKAPTPKPFLATRDGALIEPPSQDA